MLNTKYNYPLSRRISDYYRNRTTRQDPRLSDKKNPLLTRLINLIQPWGKDRYHGYAHRLATITGFSKSSVGIWCTRDLT